MTPMAVSDDRHRLAEDRAGPAVEDAGGARIEVLQVHARSPRQGMPGGGGARLMARWIDESARIARPAPPFNASTESSCTRWEGEARRQLPRQLMTIYGLPSSVYGMGGLSIPTRQEK